MHSEREEGGDCWPWPPCFSRLPSLGLVFLVHSPIHRTQRPNHPLRTPQAHPGGDTETLLSGLSAANLSSSPPFSLGVNTLSPHLSSQSSSCLPCPAANAPATPDSSLLPQHAHQCGPDGPGVATVHSDLSGFIYSDWLIAGVF